MAIHQTHAYGRSCSPAWSPTSWMTTTTSSTETPVWRRGASQPASHGLEVETFTQKELEVLQQWDSGELRTNRNNSIVALGHGRLRTARGDYLDIGGSTGGGSRRIIDGWQPPDWRAFLEDQ